MTDRRKLFDLSAFVVVKHGRAFVVSPPPRSCPSPPLFPPPKKIGGHRPDLRRWAEKGLEQTTRLGGIKRRPGRPSPEHQQTGCHDAFSSASATRCDITSHTAEEDTAPRGRILRDLYARCVSPRAYQRVSNRLRVHNVNNSTSQSPPNSPLPFSSFQYRVCRRTKETNVCLRRRGNLQKVKTVFPSSLCNFNRVQCVCVCVRTSCCSCALLAVQTPLGHCKIRTYGRTVNATYSSLPPVAKALCVYRLVEFFHPHSPPHHHRTPPPPDLTGFYDARNPERLLFAVRSRVSNGAADQWWFRSGRRCCDTSPRAAAAWIKVASRKESIPT